MRALKKRQKRCPFVAIRFFVFRNRQSCKNFAAPSTQSKCPFGFLRCTTCLLIHTKDIQMSDVERSISGRMIEFKRVQESSREFKRVQESSRETSRAGGSNERRERNLEFRALIDLSERCFDVASKERMRQTSSERRKERMGRFPGLKEFVQEQRSPTEASLHSTSIQRSSLKKETTQLL